MAACFWSLGLYEIRTQVPSNGFLRYRTSHEIHGLGLIPSPFQPKIPEQHSFQRTEGEE